MTKLVLISRDYDMSHLVPSILRAAPELDVAVHGSRDAADADVAVCWNPPKAPWPRCQSSGSCTA